MNYPRVECLNPFNIFVSRFWFHFRGDGLFFFIFHLHITGRSALLFFTLLLFVLVLFLCPRGISFWRRRRVLRVGWGRAGPRPWARRRLRIAAWTSRFLILGGCRSSIISGRGGNLGPLVSSFWDLKLSSLCSSSSPILSATPFEGSSRCYCTLTNKLPGFFDWATLLSSLLLLTRFRLSLNVLRTLRFLHFHLCTTI